MIFSLKVTSRILFSYLAFYIILYNFFEHIKISCGKMFRHNMDECFNSHTPSWLSYAICTIVIVIGVINIIGNSLACIAVWRDPLKNLRTPFNYFLANLSFSDLLIGCVTLPIFAYRHLIEHDSGDYNDKYVHTSYFLSTGASTFSLIALIVDRYIAIQWPIYYRLKINMKRSVVISVLIWVTSTFLMLGYFIFGYLDYLLAFTTVQVVMTVTVLIFVYVAVYRRLSVHRFDIKRVKKVSTPCTSSDLNKPVAVNQRKTSRGVSDKRRESCTLYEERQNRVVYAFFLQLITFLVCGVPATIFIFVLRLCNSCNCTFLQVLRDVTLLLMLTTSALNPFILALRLVSFQTALHRIFCVCFEQQRCETEQIINNSPAVIARRYGVTHPPTQIRLKKIDSTRSINKCNTQSGNSRHKCQPKNEIDFLSNNKFYMCSPSSLESVCTISIKVDITANI